MNYISLKRNILHLPCKWLEGRPPACLPGEVSLLYLECPSLSTVLPSHIRGAVLQTFRRENQQKNKVQQMAFRHKS
jgi:hypothetical protein